VDWIGRAKDSDRWWPGFCEHGNKTSGFRTSEELPDQQSNSQLFKEDFATRMQCLLFRCEGPCNVMVKLCRRITCSQEHITRALSLSYDTSSGLDQEGALRNHTTHVSISTREVAESISKTTHHRK
jgi:hypothetical protein